VARCSRRDRACPGRPAATFGVAELFLRELGLGPGDAARLRALPVEEILAAQQRLIPKVVRFMDITPPFQLVADGELFRPTRTTTKGKRAHRRGDRLGPDRRAVRDAGTDHAVVRRGPTGEADSGSLAYASNR
jgi:hypothetical protein